MIKKLKCLIVGIIFFHTGMVMAYNLDDVKRITDGNGVFLITVNNLGDDFVALPVSVNLINPPVGYEDHVFCFTDKIAVKARSSATALMLKPLVGIFPDHLGTGPDLLDNTQVEVILGYGGIWRSKQSHTYRAKYIPETKFIEVPDTTFNIGSSSKKKPIPLVVEFLSGLSK